MIDFKGHRIEKAIILTCVRWYLAYPLSYRNLKEMMRERGIEVDHSNIYRWVRKFTPKLEAVFRKGNKRPVGKSWRADETYIKIKGQWRYLYRAVDRDGQTIDFLLTAHRDKQAALDALQEETGHAFEIRQSKYLNNLVEQDHRAIKRIIRPMLGFKTFNSAYCTLCGIELMHMIKKRQMTSTEGHILSVAKQFYSLAA
ncbi:IS6 family transposase [Methylobacter marinus]|uniref:IS6 family transposase n=1 Tax=Methylobacter marinus TaxID=34058 RepID=UPI0003777B64|nr:IS6 family transposase [Methylobacter marinus]